MRQHITLFFTCVALGMLLYFEWPMVLHMLWLVLVVLMGGKA